ncbi:hypothetical protein E4F34_20530 [Burkholderia pseudomallei]|nr:hypothetical protein [Burkholderia pseudomallei]MPT73308.1 hypothetical protein [Burkholderia pseudomallei]MPT78812.1 hypothetical protein [Burkholderia pseudomallei]MPT85483.1 hypothetical protein [Burkholderia pseudomallei]MPT89008.1 hypothetical protein [Burkholderia pseudomallei]
MGRCAERAPQAARDSRGRRRFRFRSCVVSCRVVSCRVVSARLAARRGVFAHAPAGSHAP